MRANKKIAVMVLGVLITALLGNSVTAKAVSDNTYLLKNHKVLSIPKLICDK